jgi:hypothetical protein
MHRSLAATVATFAAMAALSAGSTAPKAQAVSCEGQRASCLEACHRGYFLCNRHCNGPYQFCRHNNKTGPYKPGGAGAKQNDPRPKKRIDPTQPPLKWVPNSPAKGKGVPSVPAAGTWTPSTSSGAKGPILLRSSGGRR